MKILLILSFLLFPIIAAAQGGAKVYADPNDPFTPYFTSALEKKKVPVTVTIDPTQADYTVKFHGNNSNGSLLQGITSMVNGGEYNSGAFNEISLTVIDEKTKDVVYSYTCKKYNQFTGADDRMATSVAECLAKHWKDKLKK